MDNTDSAGQHLGEKNDLKRLVSLLPEIYQPIYGHPELTRDVSRGCEDRLTHVIAIHDVMREKIKRPVRVLDLGCAQGFFSLNLAAAGAAVVGVDVVSENIDVCRALAQEMKSLNINFEMGDIVHTIRNVGPDEFDIVLGLSIFHHLIHQQGLQSVQPLLSRLSQIVSTGLFEIALRDEPVYWNESQPENPDEVIRDYLFIHEIGRYPTHISDIKRPLYFASNKYWYLNNTIGSFEAVRLKSHLYAGNSHQGTRRYYFGEGHVIKMFSINNTELAAANVREYEREIHFLSEPPEGFEGPGLLLHGRNEKEVWIVRDQLEGRLLLDYFETATPYNETMILNTILEQLVFLERAGLYHNDVRSWNVLISSEKRAFLADYGSISNIREDCVWPYDLLMSFIIFAREVFDHRVADPDPIRQPWLDIGPLPLIYRSGFLQLFATPRNQWSFSKLAGYVADTCPVKADLMSLGEGFSTVMSTMERACDYSRNLYKQEQAINQRLMIDNTAMKERSTEMEDRVRIAERSSHEAEARAAAAEIRAVNNEKVLRIMQASRSWRMTAPFRWIRKAAGYLLYGGIAWLKFAPMSRPRRILRQVLITVKSYLYSRPRLLRFTSRLLAPLPSLKERLKNVGVQPLRLQGTWTGSSTSDFPFGPEEAIVQLTPRARRIYAALKQAVEKHRENI